jgi:type III secretory pathway component EscU
MSIIFTEHVLNKLKDKSVLEEILVFELIICRELVWLIVAQYIIAINRPSACNPLMEFLIDDTFLGQLIINVCLSGNLVLGVFRFDLMNVMVFMSMTMTSTASN